jgi:hypothetical protein
MAAQSPNNLLGMATNFPCEKAYTINLAVAGLLDSNELVMVAENLGSIPPNNSLMVAMIDGKRYEKRLESTEQSSAAIRFIHKQLPVQQEALTPLKG